MTEVLFYHLTETPLESALPGLLLRSLERGWKVCIQGTDRDGLDRLDRHLWTYDDRAFLPHGMDGGPHDDRQPILLSTEFNPDRQADILMLVDGAELPADRMGSLTRVCVFFDGNNPDQLDQTRAYWTRIKAAGLDAKYWAQDAGKWVQKA